MNARPSDLLKVAALAALLAGPAPAFGQATCTVSVTPLNFGSYTGAQAQATGSVTLLCGGPQGSRANFAISASPGNSNSYGQRFLQRIAPPADTLNYSLAIQLPTGSATWGDGSAGTSVWSGRTQPINTGNLQRVETTTITGTLAAGAVPSAGVYTDTIVVTATWN